MRFLLSRDGKRVIFLLGDDEQSLPFPFSLHIQVTSRCNLGCLGCSYKGEGELSWEEVSRIAEEAASLGVIWIALGGGEPLLWENLPEFLFFAKERGLKVALTTNGTILPRSEFPLDRVHISYDPMHPVSWKTVERALSTYRKIGVGALGINSIVMDPDWLFREEERLLRADVLTLLLPKPPLLSSSLQSDVDWRSVASFALRHRQKVWLDACLAVWLNRSGLMKFEFPCRQGLSSMSIDCNLTFARCSNIPREERLPLSSLREAWERIRLPIGKKTDCRRFF